MAQKSDVQYDDLGPVYTFVDEIKWVERQAIRWIAFAILLAASIFAEWKIFSSKGLSDPLKLPLYILAGLVFVMLAVFTISPTHGGNKKKNGKNFPR